MADVGLYWNTIRHLKPMQIYGRVLFRLSRPRVDRRSAPPRRPAPGGLVAGAERRPSMGGPGRFRFLGEEREIDAHGWDDPALDKLWRYNLHYFDDLNARDSAARGAWHRALVERWVRENPPASGTGWEPYPTSLRIVNWIKWAARGNALNAAALHSLAIQTRWLAARLELHLLGNHLFANAKALIFAGLWFDGPEAAAWLERGVTILAEQVPEQILSDGGHFELSPMYHALALEDMLDLANITVAYADAIPWRRNPAVGAWRERIAPMRAWLAALSHPDGEIAFFNDAAAGIAPPPGELDAYALRLGFPARAPESTALTRLEASGYFRMEHGAAVVLGDVARIGPDYLPAHAHADTLSFELSLFGQRVLVNAGTSRYGADAERLRQRGTAAHNTVLVDGENSSEVWSGFRVARRARPLDVGADSRTLTMRGAHDGYRRLPGDNVHSRQWSLSGGTLVVADRVSGRFRTAQARLHLHPGIVLDQARTGAALALPGGQRVRIGVEGGTLRREPATWHPEFGRSEATTCLVADFAGPELRTVIAWDGA